MKCPKCLKTFTDGSRFCATDGIPLVEDSIDETTVVVPGAPSSAAGRGMACGVCGTINQGTSSHCARCGARIAQQGGQAQYGGFEVPVAQQGNVVGTRPVQQEPNQYNETAVFTPPSQSYSTTPSSGGGVGNNIIVPLVAVLLVLVGVVIFLLFKGDSSAPANTNKSNSDSAGVSSTNSPAADPEPSPTKAPNPPAPSNFNYTYVGRSGVNGKLRLTMALVRNGSQLSGSATTNNDYDELSGTISSDGSFELSGYNYKEGRVTGTWRGKLDNVQLSGRWTPTPSGRQINFWARR